MNKDLKYMPIDNRAGSWASKHMSPIFQTTTTEMSSETGKVLREDGGDDDVLLDDQKRTQAELMKQLGDKFRSNSTKKNWDQFNKSKDSIATVNQNYKGF
jgi:hypothetical protein|tara:strand:- start:119 stop:418 length:300 start_codon:yes stop_codon:yes gene_type:complete